MRISKIDSTDLFVGSAARPLQIVRVTVTGTGEGGASPGALAEVRVEGPGVSTPVPAGVDPPEPGADAVAEVGVELAAPWHPGGRYPVTVTAEGPQGRAQEHGEITAAEPGWTMWMVSHFHYDPVWWDTQGQFAESRLILPDEHGQLPAVRTAFELVSLHLDAARRDPDYKFVLAEIDYLKPHFDAHPEDREDLRRFLADGRIELVGGNYNEPNTNLTGAESTIRNAVYGLGFQRDVLGADPHSAWMLDAFGFDPGYPGLMAAAGLTSSAWARGPFHQWGPNRSVGGNTRMQFASEFEWISPDGGGLLTGYMPNHYGAGWVTHQAPDVQAAGLAAYEQFRQLAPVAATRNVLLPVGADHVIPSRWATGVHREWNARYLWPRFVMGLPREFFAAVRSEAADRGVWLTPQTRDMNPVYTGKDVTYIDTKQAQRAGETAVTNAERLATLAWLSAGYLFPAETLDKAWRQLVFGAHHDAITGTESDQVYLDLLGGWREAWQRGEEAAQQAAAYLAGKVDTAAGEPSLASVVVFNTLARPRPAMATATVALPAGAAVWITLERPVGGHVPFLAEGITRHDDGSLASVTVTFRAADLPPLGYRAYPVRAADAEPRFPGWQVVPGATAIENHAFSVSADTERGGALSRIRDQRQGVMLLRDGTVGNELVLQEEYDYHPKWNEGQWLLSPKGAGRGLATGPVDFRAERCPVGSRLVAEFTDGELRFTQETVLWDHAEVLEFRTHVDGSIGQDRMLRVRFPADVPGGLPVYHTATSVVGRPLGAADTDVADHWYTLDNPAHEWFALGSTARVLVHSPGGDVVPQAVGVAEVVTPDALNDADPGQDGPRGEVRKLLVALAAQGVTATCSRASGPRYGAIDLDSNLPDVRIALGDAEQNAFTADVLAAAGPDAAKELAGQLAASGTARLWIPATRSRADVFAPGTDARGVLDLPVLIVAGTELTAAVRTLTASLARPEVEAAGTAADPLADRSVALLNRGTPSGLVTPDGTLNLTLMRSSTAWPAAVWIDGERRTAPDGSSFNWQHWSHTFEYALAAGPGDWRTAGFTAAGEEYNQRVVTCVTGAHGGPLPAEASLGAVDPPEVALTALKPRGNPLAAGRSAGSGPSGVLVRLRETAGQPTPARVWLRDAGQARRTDLLELSDGEPLRPTDAPDSPGAVAELPAAGQASLLLQPDGPVRPATGGPTAAEPAEPVFTRYWLHGKGPAPAGNLPVAVHVSPTRLTLAAPALGGTGETSRTGTLRVTVAAGLEGAAGQVELEVPPGLTAEPGPVLTFDVPSGGWASWDVTVRADEDLSAGRRFLAAQFRDALNQLTEDAALVTVGEPPAPDQSLPLADLLPLLEADQQAGEAEITVTVPTEPLELAPGQRGEIPLRVDNHLASSLHGEAQLISPFGTWNVAEPWTAPLLAGAGGGTVVNFPVTIPATARPGSHWWIVLKVMYFGRVRYTPAIPVRVIPPE